MAQDCRINSIINVGVIKDEIVKIRSAVFIIENPGFARFLKTKVGNWLLSKSVRVLIYFRL